LVVGPGNTKKRPRLHAALKNEVEKMSWSELALPYYCFLGVAGVADLVAGFTGLVGVLPAAGAGTPD
jgi:hypothetical protein